MFKAVEEMKNRIDALMENFKSWNVSDLLPLKNTVSVMRCSQQTGLVNQETAVKNTQGQAQARRMENRAKHRRWGHTGPSTCHWVPEEGGRVGPRLYMKRWLRMFQN